jgi:hypothetical protein
MKIGELTQSKYLKSSDFPKPALCTVTNVTKENVAKPNEPKKERGVMYFNEFDKGLVLNATNLKRSAQVFGSEDTDDWIGKKIVVYHDDNVEFGGELVGGIRVRGIQRKAPPPPPDNFGMEDDIPWEPGSNG